MPLLVAYTFRRYGTYTRIYSVPIVVWHYITFSLSALRRPQDLIGLRPLYSLRPLALPPRPRLRQNSSLPEHRSHPRPRHTPRCCRRVMDHPPRPACLGAASAAGRSGPRAGARPEGARRGSGGEQRQRQDVGGRVREQEDDGRGRGHGWRDAAGKPLVRRFQPQLVPLMSEVDGGDI